jgi:regulator of protease activity HflC (stomatin/prohibitin superfamily)
MGQFRPRLMLGFLLGLTVFIYFIPETFVSIRPGEKAVLWQRFFGGTQTDKVYGEGLRVIFPWDELYIYDTRKQMVQRELDILTEEGLTAQIALAIRYHPDRNLLGELHQKLGPDYEQVIVIPEVESAMRRAVGSLRTEEIYSRSREIIRTAVIEAVEEASQSFVTIDDVVIRSVTLPRGFQEAVEEKVRQQQLAESYQYRLLVTEQEARRLAIEAGGFAAYNRTIEETLTPELLQWEGVRATKEIATSDNSKIIIMGNGSDGLPVILNAE